MAEKIEYELIIHENNGKLVLFAKPEIELELDQFSKIVSTISDSFQWKHQGIQFAGFDGVGVDFENRSDGATLSIDNTNWFGFEISSNSKEVVEKVKTLLEEYFSKL